MGPARLLHQWVKEVDLDGVVKHKECRDMTTSEPGTVNREPLGLGHTK